jgi:hypothetical protein
MAVIETGMELNVRDEDLKIAGAPLCSIVEDQLVDSLIPFPLTTTLYLVNAGTLLTGDPTTGEIDADSDSSNTSYEIMHIFAVTLPERQVRSLFATLKWSAQTLTGAGNTRWMISEQDETLGAAPSGGAIAITDEVLASSADEVYSRSGLLNTLPSGPFKLLLTGKVSGTDTITAKIHNETALEVTY